MPIELKQQIFTSAVQKAISNGWDFYGISKRKWKVLSSYSPLKGELLRLSIKWEEIDMTVYDKVDTYIVDFQWQEIVFRHDFAKSIFTPTEKEIERLVTLDEYIKEFEETIKLPGMQVRDFILYNHKSHEGEAYYIRHKWRVILQQMVVSDDIFKFIKKNI